MIVESAKPIFRRAQPDTSLLPEAAQHRLAMLQADALDAANAVQTREKLGLDVVEKQNVANGLRMLNTTISDWLLTRRTPLTDAAPATAPKGVTLASIRSDIFDLQAELRELEMQNPTRAESEERIREGAAALALQGTPAISSINRPNPSPPDRIRAAWSAAGSADPLAIVAWAIGADALADKLVSMLPPDAPDALPAAERKAAIENVQARLLAAERIEEVLVVAEVEAGRVVVRRPSADPRAVLGVE